MRPSSRATAINMRSPGPFVPLRMSLTAVGVKPSASAIRRWLPSNFPSSSSRMRASTAASSFPSNAFAVIPSTIRGGPLAVANNRGAFS